MIVTVSRFVSRLRSLWRSMTQRQHMEQGMQEEIRFHLEARTADLVRQGLSPTEAARRARVEFGGVATHQDEIRHSLGLRWWDELWIDLGYAIRVFKRSPGFTCIAAGSLALAIGANTSIFSVANEYLFERLAVPNPEQLRLLTFTGDERVVIHEIWGDSDPVNGRMRFDSFSYPVYQQLRTRNRVAGEIFAFKNLERASATIGTTAWSADAELVSGNFYEQMQVRPQLGRAILPADDQAGGRGTVVVISDSFWSRAFGRSPAVLGTVIKVNSIPMTIVGVNPRGFTGAESVQVSPDIFMPISMVTSMRGAMGTSTTLLLSTELWWVQLMTRTQPGAADEQARAGLDALLGAAVRGSMTVDKGSTLPRLQMEDGSRGMNGAAREYRQPLYLLLAMVGIVLLLACANTANLMLARAAARQREMSVRLALGASRGRILRQVLTESLLLSGAGGAVGLLLGYAGRNVLPSLVAHSWESVDMQIPFNWKVFAFTAGITVATGILFGVFPAWSATHAEVGAALKQATPGASRRRKPWSGKAIVTFQVALSTLLVVAASLFLRTLIKLNGIEPGFNTHHLQMFELSLPSSRYAPPRDIAMQTMLEEQLRSVPGVEGVTASNPPLLSGMMMSTGFFIEGAPEARPSMVERPEDQDLYPASAHVGNDFFRVMQLPMVEGRAFNAQDIQTSPAVSVINQALARKFFPNQNPIGKRFAMNGDPRLRKWIQIVGVCADSRYNNMRDNPRPVHFEPYRQQDADNMTYIVRTSLPAKSVVPSLATVVHRLDPDLPLMNIRTQDQQIDASLQQERMFASLTVGFALLALSLALVGIYGIMSYTVAQRRSEIGIRLALGARRQQVRGMVLRETGWLAVLGVATGMAIALALGRVVKSMLYGLQPNDPISLACAAALLLAIALFAGWLPAVRASSVEPMEALRHE